MIEELQNLSEERKRQVLVIAALIIMVIVVGVWLSYFNSIVAGPAKEAAAGKAASTQEGGPGIWQDIKNFFGGIGHAFTGPSQYNIQPQH